MMRQILKIFSCVMCLGVGAVSEATQRVTDKSGLSEATVQAVIQVDPRYAVAELKEVLSLAREVNLPVMVRGSQHSQGGQSLAPGGVILDLSRLKDMEMLTSDVVRVQAGATWKDVLAFLAPLGLSVQIMQSDYDFSVGGTLSTNVHGWAVGSSPFAQSVEGFHLLTAGGELLYCSRRQNTDLFQAVIGGYGLFGIIVDVDLHVVPNTIYALQTDVVATADFIPFFEKQVAHNPKARLFFGRFNLDRAAFLEKVLVRFYEDTGVPAPRTPLVDHPVAEASVRGLFKRTQGSQLFKKLRWSLEKSPWLEAPFQELPRSQLLYHSVNAYSNQDPAKTDLLQEYFIPVEHFELFVDILQSMEGALEKPLMGITLRHVLPDDETLLPYATEEMICFVLFFRGPKTAKFDGEVGAIARHLTSGALALGGTYYLPYRPYQTQAQFEEAYPDAPVFAALKHRMDPEGVFQNAFYERYLKRLASAV